MIKKSLSYFFLLNMLHVGGLFASDDEYAYPKETARGKTVRVSPMPEPKTERKKRARGASKAKKRRVVSYSHTRCEQAPAASKSHHRGKTVPVALSASGCRINSDSCLPTAYDSDDQTSLSSQTTFGSTRSSRESSPEPICCEVPIPKGYQAKRGKHRTEEFFNLES